MKGAVISLCCVVGLISLIFLTRGSMDNCHNKQVRGVVTSIYETGLKDAVVKIAGLKCAFVISRNAFRNSDLESLREKIVGKEVTVYYADRWTPLDPTSNKEISALSVGGDLLYTTQSSK